MSGDVDQIKDQLDIVDILGEYLDLKPAGQNFKALCPFHKEKTPSLIVSPEKKIWKCFGCGEGGDIFSFIMLQENLEFREALKMLAEKAGVQLSNIRHPINRAKERLLRLNELTQKYFVKTLETSQEATVARDYLIKRNLGKKAWQTFGLGYSPDTWEALSGFLKKKAFTDQELKASGVVVVKPNGRYYDRFRGRLMFVLRNHLGEIVGFAGRTLKPDEPEAKYINSPESELYHKSDFLYNLDLAKGPIRKSGFVIIVEGYTDVISSYLAGIENIVASSGTSLTIGQLSLIKRYTNNLVLAYDSDLAGNKATRRGIELALSQGLNIKVINLPAGQDPDDLIKRDPKLWVKAIKNKVGVMDYYFKQTIQGKNLSDVQAKKMVAQDLLPLINRLSDPVEKALYVRQLARELDISEEILQEAIVRLGTSGLATNQPEPAQSATTEENYSLEARITGLLLAFPTLFKEVPDNLELSNTNWQNVYLVAKKCYNEKDKISLSKVLSGLEKAFVEKAQFLVLKMESDFAQLSKQDLVKQLKQILVLHKKERIKTELSKLEHELQKAERIGNQKLAEKITQQVQALWQDLRNLTKL